MQVTIEGSVGASPSVDGSASLHTSGSLEALASARASTGRSGSMGTIEMNYGTTGHHHHHGSGGIGVDLSMPVRIEGSVGASTSLDGSPSLHTSGSLDALASARASTGRSGSMGTIEMNYGTTRHHHHHPGSGGIGADLSMPVTIEGSLYHDGSASLDTSTSLGAHTTSMEEHTS